MRNSSAFVWSLLFYSCFPNNVCLLNKHSLLFWWCFVFHDVAVFFLIWCKFRQITKFVLNLFSLWFSVYHYLFMHMFTVRMTKSGHVIFFPIKPCSLEILCIIIPTSLAIKYILYNNFQEEIYFEQKASLKRSLACNYIINWSMRRSIQTFIVITS